MTETTAQRIADELRSIKLLLVAVVGVLGEYCNVDVDFTIAQADKDDRSRYPADYRKASDG